MSKDKESEGPAADLFPMLKSYPAPWKGELLLYCTKCNRKWKKNSGKKGYINVRKGLKSRAKASKNGPKLRVLGVNCLKMCPKNGVTIATREQLAHDPAEVSIIRSESDLDALYAQLIRHT